MKNKKVEEILKKSKIKADPRPLPSEDPPEATVEPNQRYKSKAAMTVISMPRQVEMLKKYSSEFADVSLPKNYAHQLEP